jgi:Tol biopolymer transport system component
MRLCRTVAVALLTGVLAFPAAPAAADPGTTERVSVDSAGNQGNGDSFFPSTSADGRFVTFQSRASNLVPGDTNEALDIFVHDRETSTTERVSVDSGGIQGNFNSEVPRLSADGRFLAFQSSATNLEPGDSNGVIDIYVHDRQTGITTRVSIDSAGNQADSDSVFPSMSADGRLVVFQSSATNLVPGDTNGASDVFVHDRETGTTMQVSVNKRGRPGNGDSGSGSISADGRFVAFNSVASNLVPSDTNGAADVFVHDRQTGTTTRVSVDSAGNAGNDHSGTLALSANGRFVAFESFASNLAPADTNGVSDIFVHDRQTGTITRVSVDGAGSEGNGHSFNPTISVTGRFVAFISAASNLVPDDTNGVFDVFVHDRRRRTTTRVSVDSAEIQGSGDSSLGTLPAISADGRFVAFDSLASNLVPDDTNEALDVFVHDRADQAEVEEGGEVVDDADAP